MGNPPSQASYSAWQPLTFAGVAGLAMARPWRFRLLRFLMAVFSAVCLVWFANGTVFQAVRDAIQHLPGAGGIQEGKLEWPGPPVLILAQGTVVTIVVDEAFSGDAGQVTDWQVVLGKTEVRFYSVFGYLSLPYRPAWSLPLGRDALEPWWGAWEPILQAGLAGCALVFFLVVWGAIGLAYGGLLRVYAYFLDRKTSFAICWRAGQASLFSGALLLDAALLLYGQGRLDLIGLAFAFGLHLVVPWVYLLAVPWLFPPLYSMGHNPFAARE